MMQINLRFQNHNDKKLNEWNCKNTYKEFYTV